jgi:hypothetical protein
MFDKPVLLYVRTKNKMTDFRWPSNAVSNICFIITGEGSTRHIRIAFTSSDAANSHLAGVKDYYELTQCGPSANLNSAAAPLMRPIQLKKLDDLFTERASKAIHGATSHFIPDVNTTNRKRVAFTPLEPTTPSEPRLPIDPKTNPTDVVEKPIT